VPRVLYPKVASPITDRADTRAAGALLSAPIVVAIVTLLSWVQLAIAAAGGRRRRTVANLFYDPLAVVGNRGVHGTGPLTALPAPGRDPQLLRGTFVGCWNHQRAAGVSHAGRLTGQRLRRGTQHVLRNPSIRVECKVAGCFISVLNLADL
jgi:hypothetical protein